MGYRAIVGLTYPHPSDVDRVVAAGGLTALQASDAAAFKNVVSRLRRVEAGARCDDVPEVSIPQLLAAGQIEPVDAADQSPRRRSRKGEET